MCIIINISLKQIPHTAKVLNNYMNMHVTYIFSNYCLRKHFQSRTWINPRALIYSHHQSAARERVGSAYYLIACMFSLQRFSAVMYID